MDGGSELVGLGHGMRDTDVEFGVLGTETHGLENDFIVHDPIYP